MNSRKRIASWFTATLIAGVAMVSAPHLFGGGGDEGVDILPVMGGTKPPTPPPPASGTTIDVGCVRVHVVSGLTMDGKGDWHHSGVLVGPEQWGRLMGGGGAGSRAGDVPSAEVLPKGKKHLSFAGVASDVHVDGRFELIDVDPSDGEPVTLVGRWNTQAMSVVIIGVRGTHSGDIPKSFSRIDQVLIAPAFTGMVDVRDLRDRAMAHLGGSAVDIAVGLIVADPAGPIQSWASFNVDDDLAVYDVDANGR